MKVTYYGHSCFLVETQGTKLLFDPFITPNPLAANIDINKIEADYILLSHGHEDHVADAEKLAKQTGATLIAIYEITGWYSGKGIEKTHPLNIGGKAKFDFGTVKMVHAIHSSVLPDGTYGGNPGGFVIETPEKTFYYSGDTALYSDMALIGKRFNLDFAFLCLGDNFTMDVSEAIEAARLVGTDKIIGMHFDTFPYIKIDHKASLELAENTGIDLTLPKIGQEIIL